MNRRHFLKQSALASSFLMVPKVLKPLEYMLPKEGEKILVVIQLSGGNDGLNTFIPYTNDLYYKARPNIGLKDKNILKLTDHFAMNSALSPLQKWYEEGKMTIINNVGYPDMDHSHFRSMEIWQTASNANQYLDSGWLGRWLDNELQNHRALEIDDSLSLVLKGQKNSAMAFTDIKRLNSAVKNVKIKNENGHNHEDELSNYLYQTLQSAESSTSYLFEKSKTYTNTFGYPKGQFAKQLKTVADLILSGVNTRVYYLDLSGFDTHTFEVARHYKVLQEYAEGVNAFLENLKTKDKLKDTLVLTFSEFGRRVGENAAKGTDHGTAGNVWLFGEQLKTKGVMNALPDLQNLNNGDLIFQQDFRNIYATVLDKWLDANSSKILGSKFQNLNFV
jgi:uncharacterized protein (DUF1501 family)